METTSKKKASSSVRVVIYARVSTQGQDYERQLSELRDYASQMGYNVAAEFCEKISGVKRIAERQALSELLDFISVNKVDKVLVYEFSRLSRKPVDFLTLMEEFNEKKVSVYVHSHRLETLQPDGSINHMAQMLFSIMAEFASVERSLIRERMASGYNHFREKGGKVGRRKGSVKDLDTFREQYADIISLLSKGKSVRDTAARASADRAKVGKKTVGVSTVQRVKSMFNL